MIKNPNLFNPVSLLLIIININLHYLTFTAGNVTFVELFEDEMGKSMGCGLVEYSSQEEAKKAIDTLNDSKVNGREIKVKTVSYENLTFYKYLFELSFIGKT